MGRKKLKLRQKILLISAVAWFSAIVAIGGITINDQISSSMHSEIQKNAIMLSSCKSMIQIKIDSINIEGKGFAVSDAVSDLMSEHFKDLSGDEQRKTINAVSNMMYNNNYIATFKTGLSVALFCSDGRIYANPNNRISEVFLEENSPVIATPEGNGDFLKYNIIENTVFSSEYDSICGVYVRQFVLKGHNDEFGILALAIPQSAIYDAFSKTNGQTWAVLNQDNTVIASNEDPLIGKKVDEAFDVQLNLKEYEAENGSIAISKKIVSFDHDEKNNLTYVLVTPRSVFKSQIMDVVIGIIFVCAALIFVLFYLSFYLSKRFTAPLDKLESIMGDAEEGNLSVRMNPDSDDEIGRIGKRFDAMIEQLQTTMDNIQRVEQENRKAELKIMELQLKPHFLYNTLSSIIWLANEGKNDDVISITKSLAMFYRLSLSDGREEIFVNEEVKNVDYYTTIQNYRYHDRFRVYYDIDDRINECLIPKLILQPLVENSINYAMKLKENDDGYIMIRGYCSNNEVILEVADNGDNVTEERITELNRALEDQKSGIGTGIVYGRVNHYGTQYRLHYERRDGITTARINLPVKTEQKKPDA